jgi:excisionase family DNA binding protein
VRQRLTYAAHALGVPERTVRRWVHQHRLTATKRGGIYYVDMLELAELVEAQHAGGGRLARTPSGRYDAVDSPAISAEPQAPPSTPTR